MLQLRFLKLFLLSLGITFICQTHATGLEEKKPFEVIGATPTIFSPKQNTFVLEDRTGSISAQEALKRQDEFKPAADMGSIDAHSHYWIMQKIISRLGSDRDFRLEGAGWLSINTSIIRPDGSLHVLKPSGFYYGNYAHLTDTDPTLPSSAMASSQHALFTLYQGETLTLLSHTKSHASLPPKSFVLRIVDNARFLETRRFGLYIEGGLLGILFALGIFGWFSCFSNKDRTSFFYALWITFAFIQIFCLSTQDGIHFTEFIFNSDNVYFSNTSLTYIFNNIGGYGQAIFYFLFASAFLQLDKYFPLIQKITYLYVFTFLTHAIIFTFLIHNFSPQWVWMPLVLFTLSMFIMNYVCGVIRYRQGMKIVIFFLIGAIPYMCLRFIFGLGLAGVTSPFTYLPESGIRYLLQNSNVSQALGMCCEAIVMALAVVSRARWIQQDLAISLDTQKTLIENQNKVLELTVADRTSELEGINGDLKAQTLELEQQRSRLEGLSNQLAKYLPPQIHEALFSGKYDTEITTQRKKLTVFFSDIKDFTRTVESLQPEELTEYLNEYFSEMTQIALSYGATIDKYIGDAVMLFFGDPESKGVREDARACVAMALEMQEQMLVLQRRWLERGFKNPFVIRIGINTGFCNVGNFGSEQRLSYTIIGGEVNVAQRLEASCDPGGILISHDTFVQVDDLVQVEERQAVNLKGIDRSIKTYAVKGRREEADKPLRFSHTQGVHIDLSPKTLSNLDCRLIADQFKALAQQLEVMHTDIPPDSKAHKE